MFQEIDNGLKVIGKNLDKESVIGMQKIYFKNCEGEFMIVEMENGERDVLVKDTVKEFKKYKGKRFVIHSTGEAVVDFKESGREIWAGFWNIYDKSTGEYIWEHSEYLGEGAKAEVYEIATGLNNGKYTLDDIQ